MPRVRQRVLIRLPSGPGSACPSVHRFWSARQGVAPKAVRQGVRFGQACHRHTVWLCVSCHPLLAGVRSGTTVPHRLGRCQAPNFLGFWVEFTPGPVQPLRRTESSGYCPGHFGRLQPGATQRARLHGGVSCGLAGVAGTPYLTVPTRRNPCVVCLTERARRMCSRCRRYAPGGAGVRCRSVGAPSVYTRETFQCPHLPTMWDI